jgi:hypothetical protein
MDALRNSKIINLLAVAILFLLTFFNLILDAPRTYSSVRISISCQRQILLEMQKNRGRLFYTSSKCTKLNKILYLHLKHYGTQPTKSACTFFVQLKTAVIVILASPLALDFLF